MTVGAGVLVSVAVAVAVGVGVGSGVCVGSGVYVGKGVYVGSGVYVAASALAGVGVASPPSHPQPRAAAIANSETTAAPILYIDGAPRTIPPMCCIIGERTSYGRMNARVIAVPSSFPNHSHCSNAFPMSSMAKLCDITSVNGKRPRVRDKKSSATGSDCG